MILNKLDLPYTYHIPKLWLRKSGLGRDDSTTKDGKRNPSTNDDGDERMRILKFIKRKTKRLDNMCRNKYSHCRRNNKENE